MNIENITLDPNSETLKPLEVIKVTGKVVIKHNSKFCCYGIRTPSFPGVLARLAPLLVQDEVDEEGGPDQGGLLLSMTRFFRSLREQHFKRSAFSESSRLPEVPLLLLI